MKEILKNFKRIKMTAQEKQTGFDKLEAFVVNNPIQSPWYKNIGNNIISPFHDGLLLHHKMLASAFVIILLMSATAGTSIAAKYSIPGDRLYPIKINLNERLESFTALSTEAKARVEAKHVDERLSEAEQLSRANKLNDGIKTQLETQFSQDLQNTMIHVNTLSISGDSKNAKKVKVNIENSLQKHKDVIEEILKRQSSKSNKIARRAMMTDWTTSTDNETKTGRFSVTSVNTGTSTLNNKNGGVQLEAKMITDIKSENNSREERTPLLDETLKRILESTKDQYN